MRGAGCTINDLWDFDKQVSHLLAPIITNLLTAQVARTVFRPLANGDII